MKPIESVREFLRLRDAKRDERYADQLLLLACLERSEAKLREAVTAFVGVVEIGYRPTAWDLWTWTLAALAVEDRPAAEFLSTAPEEDWQSYDCRSLFWLPMQVLAVFEMIRGNETESARWVGALHDKVFEDPLPEAVHAPELRNVQQILDAIHRRDASAFSARLAERPAARAKSASPLDGFDFEALGLRALAKRRGLV